MAEDDSIGYARCGEYVIPKSTTHRYKEFLDKINEELDKPHDDVV